MVSFISIISSYSKFSLRHKKYLVKKFDVLNDQQKFLSDDTAFYFLLSLAVEKINFCHLVNQILDDFFSVLNFCFFSFKPARRLFDGRKEVTLHFESNVFLLFPAYLFHSFIKTFQGALQ